MNTNTESETHIIAPQSGPASSSSVVLRPSSSIVQPGQTEDEDEGRGRALEARPTSITSQTLHLALEQLHAALKKYGAAQSENLITGQETGYAQFVATLEDWPRP